MSDGNIVLQMSELKDVPTYGILSNGNSWILTRFIPSKDGKPARLIKSKLLVLSLAHAADCTVIKLLPELRVLLARIVQMLLDHIDTMDIARDCVDALRESVRDPAGTS